VLEARLDEAEFDVNFEIDRNKLVELYVKTGKGKISCPGNFGGLTEEEISDERAILDDFLY
jgi:hypothetical protein